MSDIKGRPKGQSTAESYTLANAKAGEHFYTDRPDRNITAAANYYKRSVKTERLITVTVTGGKPPEASYITKVTILE